MQWLASGNSASASSDSLIPLYYALISIATVLGMVGGGYRLYTRLKQRWTAEGESRATQAKAIEDNSKKLVENTAAVSVLTNKMDDFISSVRAELNGLTQRVTWLERTHGSRGNNPGRGGN